MSSDPQQNDPVGTGGKEQKTQDTDRRGSSSSGGNSTATGENNAQNNNQSQNAQSSNLKQFRYLRRNGPRTHRANNYGGYEPSMMPNMVPMLFNPDLRLSVPFMPPPHPMNGSYLTPTQPIPAQLTLPHANMQGGAPAPRSVHVNDSTRETAFRRNEEFVPRKLTPDELIKKAEEIMEQLKGQQKMYDSARANGNAVGVSIAHAVDINDLILILQDYFKLDASEQKGPLTRKEIEDMRNTRDFLEGQINDYMEDRDMFEEENRKIRADNKALRKEHGRIAWKISIIKRQLATMQQSLLDLEADAISEADHEEVADDQQPNGSVWNVDAAEFTPKHRSSGGELAVVPNPANEIESSNATPLNKISGMHRQSSEEDPFVTPRKKHIAKVVHSLPKLPIKDVQKKKKSPKKKKKKKVTSAEERKTESQEAGPSSA